MSFIDWPCWMNTIKGLILGAGVRMERLSERKVFLAAARLLRSSRSLSTCCCRHACVWAVRVWGCLCFSDSGSHHTSPSNIPNNVCLSCTPPPFPPLLLCTQLCEREGPVRERGWERRGIKKKEGWQEKRQRGQPPVCNVDEQTEDETHWVGQGLSEERRQSLVFMLCVCVRVWASGQLRCLLDSEWSPTVDTAGLAHSYKHWWLNCPAWQLLQVLADHSVLGWLWLGRNGVCVFGCLCVCLATSILIEAVAASF